MVRVGDEVEHGTAAASVATATSGWRPPTTAGPTATSGIATWTPTAGGAPAPC